jgi:hypothetical protein
MMKKVWPVLLAVVLVLGLALLGCKSGGGGEEEDNLVEKTVFVLSTDEGIQALTVGALSFADDANPIKPLVRAGGDSHVDISAITAPGGTIGLKFKTTGADWGAGIDMPYKEFGYREGDEVTVKGKLVAGTKTQLNFKEGNEATLPSAITTTVGDFDYSIILAAADISNIKGGKTTATIRIEGRPQNVEVEIYEITIKGKRPSKLTKLAAPVLTASATGISWTEIENTSGYKVIVDDDAENAETLPATATGYDMSALAAGTYKINVTALGLKDATTDSDPVEVSVSKTVPPTTEKTASLAAAATSGVGAVSAVSASSYTYTYPASGDNTNYGNGYAYFQMNLSTDKLSNLLGVKFTFKGAAGDFGWKNIYLHTKTTAFSGYQAAANAIAPVVATDYDGVAEKEFTFTIDHTKTTALENESNLYFAIIAEMNNSAGYTISGVKFVFGNPPVYAIVE